MINYSFTPPEMKSVGHKRSALILCRLHWPALLFLALGFWGYGLRAVDYFAAVPGDLGDARFNSVILEHLFQRVTGSGIRLWSPAFFYPFEGVLAFSDNHFGSALPYVLLRSIGAGREVAFDGWFLTGITLNFVCTYAVIRRLGLSSFAAAAGAFAFAFALPILVQEVHAQLTYRFAIPLAYLAFFEAILTKRLYPLWRVGFWSAVQFFCSIYLGIFLVYLLIGSFCGVMFWNRGSSMFRDFQNSIVSEVPHRKFLFIGVLAISGATVAWLLYSYHLISSTYGGFKRSPDEIVSMLPRLSSYLLADGSGLTSWIGHFIDGIPMRHEHQMFFGIGIWALALYGTFTAWRGKLHQDIGRLATFAVVMLFLLTLSLGGISLYRLLSYVPGLNAVRAVTRIGLVMIMPIAVLVAIGSQHILNQVNAFNNVRKIAVYLILLVLLGAEVVAYRPYNTPIATWAAQQAVLREKLPSQLATDAILYITGKTSVPGFVTELDGVILAQDLGYPTLNGYSGNTPPNYLEPQPCISYRNRINSYATYKGVSLDAANALAARVVVIALEACDPVIAALSSQAKQISLALENVSLDNHELKANLLIHNNSEEDFNTLRSSGPPLRASWRFMEETLAGQDLSSKWDPRKDLARTIAPGGSASIDLAVPLPQMPGKYLFQVSLVQDGVAWFHDMGMKVLSVPVTVEAMRSRS
ncbi:hypothetical protein [Ramlibacter sp. 2FC]|uniref:hypothetical protein n=1 Tax=Ramlibacter sp. 2FC TaxID=2502188 RepID=UPI0010F9FE1A|nr:hypothetical protein [Ramlibacter sp. 2FC]